MLGQKRLSFVALAMFAGLLSSIGAQASDRVLVRPVNTKHVDLDENSVPASEADLADLNQILSAGGAGSCLPVGGATTAANGQFRYRGNVLHIDADDAKLLEFKMALRFSGTIPLSFSIHKRDVSAQPEAWRRVFLRTAQASGNNSFQFYSSGPVTLDTRLLEANTDYAFGVTWGGSTVFFVRDSVLQPKQLGSNLGQSLGFLSYNGVQPPVDEELPSPTVSTIGAYQMEFCFEPVEGACCLSSTEACVPSKATACNTAGSFFHGERTACADVLCAFGACCSPCLHQCKNRYTPGACAAEQGTHHRSAVCPTVAGGVAELCPEIKGACCNGSVCDELCRDDCVAQGGTYRGDHTDCEPDICVGACCISGFGCVKTTQSNCSGLFFGSYRGDGSTCERLSGPDDPNNPDDPGECGGGCCFSVPVSSCTFKRSRRECTEQPGGIPNAIYKGDAIGCGGCPHIDTVAACCLPDGTCINATVDFCESTAKGKATAVGMQCTDIPIGNRCLTGPCCFSDGHCEALTDDGCIKFGGISHPTATSCGQANCLDVIVTGACCRADGCANQTLEAECVADGGIYKGDTSTCTESLCDGLGSCCTPENACVEPTTQSFCEDDLRGTFNDAMRCSAEGIDCDHRGACCLPNGGCTFLVAADCEDVGGSFKGEETFCETTDICPAGACCLGNGGCGIRGIHACNNPSAGLVYQGDDTTCTLGLCTLGACCDGTTCRGLPGIPQVRSQCDDLDEVFGPGQTCVPGACQVGVCCVRTAGGLCLDATRVVCLNGGGSYHGGGLCPDGDVTIQPCDLGACCSLSGTCGDGVFAFECPSTSSFTVEGACANLTCEARGACCVPGNEECQIMTPSACASAGGTYSGDGAACSAALCALGACCSDDLGCQESSHPACNAVDGSFQGPGTTCKTVECPLSCHDVIVSTVPSNCAVDPGYPHTPAQPPNRPRWITLDLTFECDARTLIPTDFSVREEPVDEMAPPRAITDVDPIPGDANSVRLTFEQFIKLGRWTCVTHIASGAEICIGFLPGDVNADRTADLADLMALLDNLVEQNLPVEQCDIDRSGGCFPTDLIEEIDLQNGADPMFPVGTTLPECPTAP